MPKMTIEKLREIDEYRRTHNAEPLRKYLKEIGYTEWSYYSFKRKMSEEDLDKGGFLPLKKNWKQDINQQSSKSSPFTIEIRTQRGTEMRLIGDLSIEMLKNLVANV